MIDVLIISSPYQVSHGPSLAPALLKACAERHNLQATAWDLAAEFNLHIKNTHYQPIIDWMQTSGLQISDSDFEWYLSVVSDYVDRIISQHPKYLAISVMTYCGQRFVEDLAVLLKQKSNIKIIVGGSGANVFNYQYQKQWYQVLLEGGVIDTVVVGEGEEAIAKVVNHNLTGIYHEPQLTNDQLNEIPTPDYSDYDLTIYDRSSFKIVTVGHSSSYDSQENPLPWIITGSKGCVRNCSFCDVNKQWGHYRFRSGTAIANEIIDLHHRYGAEYFSFTDSLINGGLRTMIDMNTELEQRLPRKIRYDCQAIFRSQQDMPERYFASMANAGCYHVNIGVETGSNSVRDHMRKQVSDSDLEYSASMFLRYNILQTWNIVVGYPTETDADFEKTIDMINHWHTKSNGKIKFNPTDTFLMIPGTPIMEEHYLNDLGIDFTTVNGYSDFAWTASVNPSNTYDVRAGRFVSICNLLKLLDPSNTKQHQRLDLKAQRVLRRLEWFNDHQTKKVFYATKV